MMNVKFLRPAGDHPDQHGRRCDRAFRDGGQPEFCTHQKETLQSQKWENIWVLGDAANIPASKAGSVIHFQMEIAVDNILQHMAGKEMTHNLMVTPSATSRAATKSRDDRFLLRTGTRFRYVSVPGGWSILRCCGRPGFNHLGKLAFRLHVLRHVMLKGIHCSAAEQIQHGWQGKSMKSN